MKFRKSGQIVLALLVSLGLMGGVTSCTTDYTIGYMFVTGTSPKAPGAGQVSAYKIANNSGKLTAVSGSPFTSGGVNPRRAIMAAGNLFLYVLNGGSADPADATKSDSSNISLFSVGGGGTLNFQASYQSQGNFPLALTTDSSGSFLFVLDQYAPVDTTDTPTGQANQLACVDSAGVAHTRGEITAFKIDGSTGRLQLVFNEQQKTADGSKQLTYFPVGCFPTDFKLTGSFLYTIEAGTAATNDVQSVFVYGVAGSTGQLTLTQNVPLPTGASNLTAIGSGASYIYLFDAGPNPGAVNNISQILPYTPGSSGILQTVTGGALQQQSTAQLPTAMLVDNTNKFLYVTNGGPSSNVSNPE